MDKHKSPAENFLQSEPSPQSQNTWPHSQAAADFFSMLWGLGEASTADADGGDCLTWKRLNGLMEEALPAGLEEGECVGPARFDREKVENSILELARTSELERLASMVEDEISYLGELLLTTEGLNSPVFLKEGYLSIAFWTMLSGVEQLEGPEILDPLNEAYVGDDKLIQYFEKIVEIYKIYIEGGLLDVVEEANRPELKKLIKAVDAHLVYLDEWRLREVEQFQSGEAKKIRLEQQENAKDRRSEISEQKRKIIRSKNQNFLFKAGMVVVLILVTWLWKRYVG